MKLTGIFKSFFNTEKAGGMILILCTIISLILANSPFRSFYIDFWNLQIAGHSIEHSINHGLMTIFFLMIGLELERELYRGELAGLRNALFPTFSAVGGMLVPAGIYMIFNYGTENQSGAGIPMATDIAFAVGMLAILGKRIPETLKVFLIAFAVMDDLGSIIIIAVFYAKGFVLFNLLIVLFVFAVLLVLNRLKFHNLIPYLIGGGIMWYFMLHSGIHATITGVLLAFAIPFGDGSERSPSYILEHKLHKPVAFFVLPLFALANTSIIIDSSWINMFEQPVSQGIIFGLVLGKPIGIFIFSFIAIILGICTLPSGLKWSHIIGAGFLGGIGFTMSIFITLLAFEQEEAVNYSKAAILIASFISAVTGLLWLKFISKDKVHDKICNTL